ncbi:membrane-associated sensor domain-containing protein [Aeromonas hydrophila]|uniref:sensor domain-containing diguanylate cyclase n=1 Tax=Aeromonas hydrophila TaxID=644 RepID=UPI00208E6905|nr:membrane-associated sensor domain-containing protein [Aeromonas hydrophila]MCO4199864.1 membrane-associated sensor domain-containing protein [Aeromonas hydrophila]
MNMLSDEQRRLSSHLEHHLYESRRHALSKGLRWFWAVNQLAILFLLARFYVYQDAHLVVARVLPWSYEVQLVLMTLACLSFPLFWHWLSRQPPAIWQPCLRAGALLWGIGWALLGYAIALVELRGGFSLAFDLIGMLLMTALVALYCEVRLFYCFSTPPLLFLLLEALLVKVPFPAVHWMAVGCLIIMLETGRRMLNGWFELAVSREHENLTLARQLDAMAKRDPLTGLANRRHFDNVGEQILQEAREQHGEFAILLLDVDFFKRFNDHYGHLQGDNCLIAVADCLREAIRQPADVVARYGGEEFVLLLPGADALAASAIAKRIAAALAGRGILHALSEVSDRVTVSQGIALWHGGQDGIADMLVRADEALYQVKEAGRNGYRLAP